MARPRRFPFQPGPVPPAAHAKVPTAVCRRPANRRARRTAIRSAPRRKAAGGAARLVVGQSVAGICESTESMMRLLGNQLPGQLANRIEFGAKRCCRLPRCLAEFAVPCAAGRRGPRTSTSEPRANEIYTARRRGENQTHGRRARSPGEWSPNATGGPADVRAIPAQCPTDRRRRCRRRPDDIRPRPARPSISSQLISSASKASIRSATSR